MGNRFSPNLEKATRGGDHSEHIHHVKHHPTPLEYAISSMIGRRSSMEDAHLWTPLNDHRSFLGGVFDGHGGSYAAKNVASTIQGVLESREAYKEYCQMVQRRLKRAGEWHGPEEKAEETLEAAPMDDDKHISDFDLKKVLSEEIKLMEQALQDTFLEVDRQLYLVVLAKRDECDKKEQDHKGKKGGGSGSSEWKKLKKMLDNDAGTTACCVVVTPEYVVCANAGDSRALLVRSPSQVLNLSSDHKPMHQKELDRITQAGGYVFGSRLEDDLAVSRGFGDYRFKEDEATLHGKSLRTGRTQAEMKVSPLPDICTIRRVPSKDICLVVACDGIFDVRTNEELKDDILQLYAEGESNGSLIAEELLDMCLRLGSTDNMSLILVDFKTMENQEGPGVMGRRDRRDKKKKIKAKKLPIL